MRIKALINIFDTKSDKQRLAGEEWDESEDRAKELIERGHAAATDKSKKYETKEEKKFD